MDMVGPARRRHRARLQQRAVGHHDGERLPAERAQADRSVVPGHHADQQNATRAATLVRQLLAFSRRQTLRPQVLDLGDALSDLTMLLRRLIGEKGQARPRAPAATSGRSRSTSRSSNRWSSISRSTRATPCRWRQADGADRQCDVDEAAQLTHKGMPAADYVRIDISDTGTGIPADIVDKIFEPFILDQGGRQGHRAWSLDGLRHRQADRRLRLCGLCARRGHLVPHLPAAASSRPGRPSPRCRGANGAAKGATAEPPKPRPDLTGQGTILLVEDEDGLRSLNARGLRSRGYSVIEAANGIEAMEALDEKDGAVGSRRLRRRDAGNGRPNAAARNAQAQSEPEDHLRLRLPPKKPSTRACRRTSNSPSCPSHLRSARWSRR